MRYLILSVALICVPAAFGQAIIDFSGGAEYDSYYGSAAGDVVGYRFTVSETIEVTDLGVWNMDTYGAGGVDSPHQVGIWDDTETLVADVTVDATGTVVGDWIYESISLVVLNPGTTYTIGALYLSGDDDRYISGAASATTYPMVTWENAVYPTEGELGFVYPALDSPTSSVGRFGPNFIFNPTPLVRSTWGSIKASMQ